jgi:hypothetical protein
VLPTGLAAQSAVTAAAGVERTPSYDVNFTAPAAPGCDQWVSHAALATTAVTCTGVAGAVGSAFASVSREGVLRASGTLQAAGLPLGPAGSGADVLSAVGRAGLHDVVSITPLAAVTPTSFTLSVDWDGTYAAPATLPGGVQAYVSGFLGFVAAGFDPLQRGWSGWTWSNTVWPDSALVDAAGNGRYAGGAARTVTASGLTQTTVRGRSSFVNIPFSSATFDFHLALVAETMFRNVRWDANVVSGSLTSDFAQSARVSGFQVYAGTTDVTDQVRVTFASGYQVPLGAPPTLAPEPTTLALAASGLALTAGVARRRRRSRQSV